MQILRVLILFQVRNWFYLVYYLICRKEGGRSDIKPKSLWLKVFFWKTLEFILEIIDTYFHYFYFYLNHLKMSLVIHQYLIFREAKITILLRLSWILKVTLPFLQSKIYLIYSFYFYYAFSLCFNSKYHPTNFNVDHYCQNCLLPFAARSSSF